jgi:hypothetical protein
MPDLGIAGDTPSWTLIYDNRNILGVAKYVDRRLELDASEPAELQRIVGEAVEACKEPRVRSEVVEKIGRREGLEELERKLGVR